LKARAGQQAAKAPAASLVGTFMRLSALDRFVCPLSRAPFQLISFEEEETVLSAEETARARRLGLDPGKLARNVKEGVLYCETSRKWYPIINYIPLLLDYGTELHRAFRDRHAGGSDIFRSYELADEKPRPGEELVQKSFTKEWEALSLDDLSFGLSSDQRDEFIKLELDWPVGLLDRPVKILEVGCGSGFESMSLDRVTAGEICGIDLNLALLRNGATLSKWPFLNLAVASLFRIPARPKSFDIVYSSGCLHHTWSTQAAFDAICEFRREDGFIYIWVYALEDSARTIYMRMEWSFEEIVRPRLARLPEPAQNLIVAIFARYMYWWYKRHGAYNRERWTLRNAEHAVRDRWTPLYAHRHSLHDVIAWFFAKGLDFKPVNSGTYLAHFKTPLFGIGMRGIARSSNDRNELLDQRVST
jgi:uncharacterized protein YbaR (Trm112 family)/SAM-dependent methyltransferase